MKLAGKRWAPSGEGRAGPQQVDRGYGLVSRLMIASVTRSKASPLADPAAVTSAAQRAW
jgi:hypothetical protein